MCQEEESVTLWTGAIKKLREWLRANDTEQTICDSLCMSLLAWQASATVDNVGLQGAAQISIWWDRVIEGVFCLQWRSSQQLYLTSIGSRKSAVTWMVSVIRKIWHIAWEMWEHRNNWEHQNVEADLTLALSVKIEEYWHDIHTRYTQPNLLAIFGPLIQVEEMSRVRKGTKAYEQDWLQNIQAAMSREQRRDSNSQMINNMRNCMRNFLGK
jgi:predicted transposase YbfD/YdcC